MELKLYNIHSEFKKIEKIWCALEATSFFTSWPWIKCWIQSLPVEVNLSCAVFYKNYEVTAAFFVGQQTKRRNYIVSYKGIFFNSTGIDDIDRSLWAEYNGVVKKGNGMIALCDIINMLPYDWDEFLIPCFEESEFQNLDLESSFNIELFAKQPSHYVNLDKIKNKDYLSLLSSNTRSQIRRAYKGYSAMGKVSIVIPESIESAMAIFNEMLSLHRDMYLIKSRESSFISDYSVNFHKTLILSLFEKNHIQLIKVIAGESIIGILYNFVYMGRVFFYQSGLNYSNDKRLKPGHICHCEAIKYSQQEGNHVYDFLAGNERYKDSLSTDVNSLCWMKIQKKKMVFNLESIIKSFLKK